MSREWVTVPAEPTPEMVEEICRSHTTEEWPNAFGASAQEIRRDYARAGWAAALAAAPHPPIAQPDVLRAAAEKARAALSDLLLKRDPIVYSDALRALDEALAQAPGWRPISEAPRDGSTFLIWTKRCGFVVVHHDPSEPVYVSDLNPHGFSLRIDDGKFQHPLRGDYPTHWQPLPEHPSRDAVAAPAAASSASAPAEVPMPEPDIVSYQTDSTMRRLEVRSHSGSNLEAYAAAREAAAVERVRVQAASWRRLYRRAINAANWLTNYVEDRPELRRIEREMEAIDRDARAEDEAARAELGEKP